MPRSLVPHQPHWHAPLLFVIEYCHTVHATATVQKTEEGLAPLFAIALRGAGCETTGEDSEALKWDCLFKKLYRRSAGFDRPRDRDGSDTYGEILPSGISSLFAAVPEIALQQDDVFYDVGSGTSKIPIQLFLTSAVQKSVGIEFASARHAHAVFALDSLYDLLASAGDMRLDKTESSASLHEVTDPKGTRQLTAVQGDMFEEDMADASVVLASSLAFSEEVSWRLVARLATLQAGTIVFLGRKCAGCHRGLLFLREVNVESTWYKKSSMFVYVVTPDTAVLDPALVGQARFARLSAVQAGNDIMQHRTRGEESSAGACVAADLEALASQSMSRLTEALPTTDFLPGHNESDSVLIHLANRRIMAKFAIGLVRGDPNGATQKGFVEFQQRKAERLLELITRVLSEPSISPHVKSLAGESLVDLALKGDDAVLEKLFREHGVECVLECKASLQGGEEL